MFTNTLTMLAVKFSVSILNEAKSSHLKQSEKEFKWQKMLSVYKTNFMGMKLCSCNFVVT